MIQTVNSSGLATSIAVLVAMVCALLLAGKLLKKAGYAGRREGTTRLLQIDEVLPLDARRKLHIVACDGRRLLVLTGPSQDLFLGWLPGTAP